MKYKKKYLTLTNNLPQNGGKGIIYEILGLLPINNKIEELSKLSILEKQESNKIIESTKSPILESNITINDLSSLENEIVKTADILIKQYNSNMSGIDKGNIDHLYNSFSKYIIMISDILEINPEFREDNDKIKQISELFIDDKYGQIAGGRSSEKRKRLKKLAIQAEELRNFEANNRKQTYGTIVFVRSLVSSYLPMVLNFIDINSQMINIILENLYMSTTYFPVILGLLYGNWTKEIDRNLLTEDVVKIAIMKILPWYLQYLGYAWLALDSVEQVHNILKKFLPKKIRVRNTYYKIINILTSLKTKLDNMNSKFTSFALKTSDQMHLIYDSVMSSSIPLPELNIDITDLITTRDIVYEIFGSVFALHVLDKYNIYTEEQTMARFEELLDRNKNQLEQ
jgi:hypothetical protein